MNESYEDIHRNGQKHFKAAQYSSAISCFSALRDIAQSKGDENAEASSLQALGNCYEKTRDYCKAVEVLHWALEIAKRTCNRIREGEICSVLGNVFLSMRKYDKALEMLSKALALFKNIPDARGEGATLQSLGNLYHQLGLYDLAVKMLTPSIEISREQQDEELEAASAQVLGSVYNSMGEYDSAIVILHRSSELFSKLSDADGLALYHSTLGSLYENLGKYDLSLEAHNKALVIYKTRQDSRGQAVCLNSIGNARIAQGQHEMAVETLLQSLELAEQVNDNEACARAQYAMGLARIKLNELVTAVVNFEAAIAACESIQRDLELRDEARIAIFEQQRRCYVRLVDCLVSLDRSKEALTASERGKARALRHMMNNAVDSELSEGDSLMDWESIKQMAMEQKVGVLVFSALEEYELAVWLVTPTGELSVCGRISIGDPKGRKGTLSGELELMLCAIGAGSGDALARDADTANRSPTVSLAADSQAICERQIVQALELSCNGTDGRYRPVARKPEGSEILVRIRGEPKMYEETINALWRYRLICDWLDSLCQAPGCPMDECQELCQAIKAVKGAVICWSDVRDLNHEVLQSYGVESINIRRYLLLKIGLLLDEDRLLKQFYTLLIAPIEEELREIPNLLIVPDLMLWVVPWPALTDSAGIRLIQRHSIRLAPSLAVARVAARAATVLSSRSPVVVGNPHNPSYRSLPHSVDEANAVAVQFKVRPLIGSNATKAAVQQALGSATWAHLACHACLEQKCVIFSPCSPDDSGSLTAADVVAGPRLAAHSTVVLSACSTGRREIRGEGVVGLARAFLVANAAAVVVSLWGILDNSTRMLMEAMYAALAHGYAVPEALQFAMIMMIEHGELSPLSWAGFIVVGARTCLPKNCGVESWSVDDVCSLFNTCGFPSEIVKSNSVDGKTLLSMSAQEMESELALRFLQVKRLRTELEAVNDSVTETGVNIFNCGKLNLEKMEQDFSRTNNSWFVRINCSGDGASSRNMSDPKSDDDFAALTGSCEKAALLQLGFNFILNDREVCVGNGLLENGFLTIEALEHCLGITYPDTYVCLWGAEGRVVQLSKKMLCSNSSGSSLSSIIQDLEKAVEFRRKEQDKKCRIRRALKLALLNYCQNVIASQIAEVHLMIQDILGATSCVIAWIAIKLPPDQQPLNAVQRLSDPASLMKFESYLFDEISKISNRKVSALRSAMGSLKASFELGINDSRDACCLVILKLGGITKAELFGYVSSKERDKTYKHEYMKQQLELCVVSLKKLIVQGETSLCDQHV